MIAVESDKRIAQTLIFLGSWWFKTSFWLVRTQQQVRRPHQAWCLENAVEPFYQERDANRPREHTGATDVKRQTAATGLQDDMRGIVRTDQDARQGGQAREIDTGT